MYSRRDFLVTAMAGGACFASCRRLPEPSDLTTLTLENASQLLRARSISPIDLVRAYLDRIERFNPRLNAFITVTAEEALAQARQREEELSRNRWRGPLHGIPIALKDNIDTKGVRTTAGSKAFADRVPADDAEVVRRLLAAGAVLVGKLNLHECAFGPTAAISHYGPVRNPWNLNRITGGSSGGAGAAVAARLCPAAVGTDTGGSIRIPAAYCGIVGLKPTYGLVSIRGVLPLARTLDHVGPMCRTVTDAALVLQAIAGYDAADPTSANMPVPDFARASQERVSALRVGVPQSPFLEDVDEEIHAAFAEAVKLVRSVVTAVDVVELPEAPSLPIVPVEAYTFHAEYLNDKRTRQLYHPEIQQRLLAGRDIPASAYVQARHHLALLRREIEHVFSTVDLLVTPTTPNMPMTIERALQPQPVPALELRNTWPFNVFGLPSISIPCGFSRAGLPIGLQISGRQGGETEVLALAHAYETATDWKSLEPRLPSADA